MKYSRTHWRKYKEMTKDYSKEFILFFKATLETRGWKPWLPWQLLDGWDSFVEGCEEGYQWTIYEYYDEIGVRDYLDLILNNPLLNSFMEASEFREAVYTIDKRFRSLAFPEHETEHQEYWWTRMILKRAGQQYAEDVFGEYGVRIEVIPSSHNRVAIDDSDR